MTTSERQKRSILAAFAFGATLAVTVRPADAIPAPDGNSVLILDDTVSGGAASNEASKAAAQGFTVVVATAAQWSAATTAEFSTYKALILGDPTCT